MNRAILAAACVLASVSSAFAVEVQLDNGGFENDGTANGFVSTISDWTVSFTGTAGSSAISGEHAQIAGSFARWAFPPEGSHVVGISSLGGSGQVTLSSGASGVNFAVNDRLLGFRYVYLTNDAPDASSHDRFIVQIDFFGSATSTTSIGSISQVVAQGATDTDSQAGFSPLGGVNNNATTIYNNAEPGTTDYNFVAVDISQFYGSFARVSFIVDNNGPGANTNNNGLGVTMVLLDDVILTPEPSALALFGLGIAGLGGFAWRRRRAAPAAAKRS